MMFTFLPCKNRLAGSTLKPNSSKRKRGHVKCPLFLFGGTDGRFAFGNIFRSPYENKLSTASLKCAPVFGAEHRAGSTPMSIPTMQKAPFRVLLWMHWWNRRELNPCPKTSWYNLLRGQSYLLGFPAVSADRQALTLVALLCLTDTRAKSRFRCTTNLTHGGSRSPHPRYGRHFWPRHSLRCKSNFSVVVYF